MSEHGRRKQEGRARRKGARENVLGWMS